MAVANTKSTIVTNAEATPPTLVGANLRHGRVRAQVGTVEVAAADDAASLYRMCRVHSSWRPHRIDLFNDAITSLASAHVGLYDVAANGGAAVSNSLFATAVDLSSARVAPLDVLFEQLDIANVEKAIWQLLGLSADPNKWYDLCVLSNSDPAGAGTITIRFEYVAND